MSADPRKTYHFFHGGSSRYCYLRLPDSLAAPSALSSWYRPETAIRMTHVVELLSRFAGWFSR